jgi:hypothetical protein
MRHALTRSEGSSTSRRARSGGVDVACSFATPTLHFDVPAQDWLAVALVAAGFLTST